VDQVAQALVLGIVQGLTEFLPISSSGHLILVPYLLGWNDPFLTSLAFSVVLHGGTLLALLVFFRHEWLRLIPAGLATLRDRSFAGDPARRLAWLIAAATVPAVIAGVLLNDVIEQSLREPGLVAVMLVVAAGVLWIADRLGRRVLHVDDLSFPAAFGIGVAQALALVPGVSRSGISISAGLFAGLDRESAARFSFLMATPVTAGAVAYETLKLVRGETVEPTSVLPLVVGVVAAFVAGMLAIGALLAYVRTRSYDVFVAYRLVLAAVVLVIWLRF
jgi:undecaprenyl-diphosphatase